VGCCRNMARKNAPIGSEVRSRRGAIGYVTAGLNLNPCAVRPEAVSPLTSDQGGEPRSPLRVNLGRKLNVRAESAFPTITDIVDYGRDLRHAFIRSWLRVYEFTH
jgi:hypothetical protein